MCSASELTSGIAVAVATVCAALWLIDRRALRRQATLTLLVARRGIHALAARGVPRTRALELIAPELRDAYARRYRH